MGGEHSGNGGELGLGPPLLYPLKAAATRARTRAWRLRSRGRPDTSALRILFYHRVSDDHDELAVPPRRFRAQMEALARAGWTVAGVDEIAGRLARGEDSGRVIGLTFDDAYLDVGEHAEPVLRELGFAATVFVATGVTDGRARFTWYGADQPPLLGWKELRALDGGVLRFEAHTVTHPNLLALPEAEAREEIAGSKRELEERLGRPVTAFCYPAGLFADVHRTLVAEAGYEVAVTCEPGPNRAGADPLALRRIQVDARDEVADVLAKAGGGHDTPLPLRAAWRRLRYGSPRPESSRS